MTLKVRFTKVINDAVIPSYQTIGSAGCDVCSAVNAVIYPSETKLIPTGLRLEIPEGYECQVRSRSGLASKSNIFVLNSPGTIDSDFRGEVNVILHNLNVKPYHVKKGDRIAQLVFTSYEKVEFELEEKLSDTERGSSGFGSSGV